jgi:hypothetical protein
MAKRRILKKGWADVTPKHLRCGIGMCPAVYKTDVGKYVVVGRTLSSSEVQSALPNRVAADETAIEIDAAFLEMLGR